MIKLSSPFRLATKEDAPILVQLVNHAGEGLPEYIWSKMAESSPGSEKRDPWEIGRERQANLASQGKIIVLQDDGLPVAGLTGYVIGPEPEPIPDDMPEMFKPLQELENAAPNSWYINVLATLPEHRGKGHGSKLLNCAEDIAVNHGLSELSLIVADNNKGARKLYERSGFVEQSRRPLVRENWITEGREWVLMTKRISTNSQGKDPG
ncbi:MAG: GNAT family N-acetyltransferase [Rhizobiaceae bacterium]